MMVATSRRYVEQAFAPLVSAGLGSTAAEISALAARVAAGDSSAEEAYREALKSYYAEGGTYQSSPSVQAAESVRQLAAPPPEMPAPMLYAAEECDIKDGACIARNAARQQANMALMENARRAYNLQVCEYNAAINPGQDLSCDQFRQQVPVPPASGPMQQAVCTGGQCYTPAAGDTAAVSAQEKARQEAYGRQYTSAGVPRQQPSVPNQTTPPRPQPGEVPATDTGRQAETPAVYQELPAGTDWKTYALIAAAAVVGLFLVRGAR